MTTALSPIACGAALTAIGTLISPVAAQAPTTQELLERINAQDRRIAELTQGRSPNAADASMQEAKGLPLKASYDGGFRLRSTNPDLPFELKINGRMQFRWQGFNSRTDAAVVNDNRNDFEIERGRLEFAGTFLDQNAHFYINLDADTDDNHNVIFHDFWVNYDLAKNHSLYVGKAFVPGTRDWISGSTRTHFIDRSMATTFFRPDRSIGVWAIGKMYDVLNYRIMVGNGLKTTDLKPSQVDSHYAYAGSFWVDLGAPYGKGYADLQQHEQVAARVGTSVSYTRQDEGQGSANAEAGAVRLSNGVKLSDPIVDGGLAIDKYDYRMGTIDAAIKYRGFAANSEFFFRSLDDLRTEAGPAARTSYYDWGGYVDAGFMIVPKTLEPIVRVSSIQGAVGDSWEYAAGINYYVNGTHLNKFSFDASRLDGCPTSNSGPGYRVGDDGWLFRVQWQIAF